MLGYGAFREELNITPATPPAFLVHADDDALSAEGSARVYIALKKAGVPAELHVYRRGGHGFGMQNKSIPVSSWPARLQDWMADQGLLKIR